MFDLGAASDLYGLLHYVCFKKFFNIHNSKMQMSPRVLEKRLWTCTFINFTYLFIFWLCWIFVAARSLSLRRVGATLRRGTRASHCGGFSCCGAQALGVRAPVVAAWGLSSCGSRAPEHRLSSCGARA